MSEPDTSHWYPLPNTGTLWCGGCESLAEDCTCVLDEEENRG